jgi:lipopolysaccharide/colanic/teichoic acid biosynthesis glycosyltransferase
MDTKARAAHHVRGLSHAEGTALTGEKRLYELTKRGIDILSAAAGLILLSPLFCLCAIGIKLDSRGPVFFKQARRGRGGRIFKMLKLRTMVDGAAALRDSLAGQNEVDGPVFKIKDDPRLTKMGAFLRHYSIDELPQLVNVLKGEMSLVGPRPLPVDEVDMGDPVQIRRLSVPPGLSCYWQINGRSDVSFDEWMDLDLEYIANRSLLEDLKIVALTIPAVFKGDGAY